MAISVIVPTLNESRALPNLLALLGRSPEIEIIVSDGGSSDGTPELVNQTPTARLIGGVRGRGPQMNAGARAARGDILFFLHADTVPPAGFEKTIAEILSRPGVSAGAFRLSVDAAGLMYRAIEFGANVRSRLFQLPYGDQGFFLKRATFERTGGFADIPLMEDVDMVRRCCPFGVIVTAAQEMRVSARRWQKEGRLMSTARNLMLFMLFLAGVPARRLAMFYPPHMA